MKQRQNKTAELEEQVSGLQRLAEHRRNWLERISRENARLKIDLRRYRRGVTDISGAIGEIQKLAESVR